MTAMGLMSMPGAHIAKRPAAQLLQLARSIPLKVNVIILPPTLSASCVHIITCKQ